MTLADVPNATTAELRAVVAELGQGAIAYRLMGLVNAPNVLLVQACTAELTKRGQ